MKKFSLKKLTAIALAATGVATLSGAVGCLGKKTADLVEPDNIEITRLPKPDDGSLPTAHTCAENMAYVVSVFDSQPKYHSYSYGVTSASIATQTTRTFRDYYGGVLLTTDLTYSSMVKSGTQTCTVFNEEGEGEVYFRTSAAPQADTLPAQAEWSMEAPTYFSRRAYNYTYGLLPTELFNYIVNEQNIISSEQLKVNADGTYTQNFVLDPDASTYFYQFGMKTRGGLSSFPEFESISFSVTFDKDWRILSSDMREVAKINKGVVVTSVSDFSTQYWYGDDHFDDAHFAYYDSYYKNYLGDEDLEQGGSVDDKPIMDVANVLSNGFSQIMNGGAQFEVDLDLGKNSYEGYVFLSLDLADPLESLALKLSLGKNLNNQNLYVEYGDGEMAAYYGKDFALSANLAEVKLAVGKFGEIIEKISQTFAKGETANSEAVETLSDGAEEGDALTALMNFMTLVSNDSQVVLTLATDDLLGTGIGLKARLVFGISNNEIIFRGGTVSDISIGGEKLDLRLKIQTTTAPQISRDSVEAEADLADYIADVYSLLDSELLKVQLGLHGNGDSVSISQLKGINADVTAFVDIYGITAGAEVKASYALGGKEISATLQAWYNYGGSGYGDVALALTEFNGAPADIKLHCNIGQLVDGISMLITTAGGADALSTDGLVNLINGALSSDFSGLITELYADKAQLKIGVSVDTVLDMLNVNTGIKFGSCTLKYQRGEGVYGGELSAALPALGFNLSVSGAEGQIETPDLSDSLDLVYVVEDVKALTKSDLFKLTLTLDGDAEGVQIKQLGGINADLTAYLNLNGLAVAADADLSYTYGGNTLSAKLSAYYVKGETGLGDIALSLKEINGKAVAANVRCNIDEIKEGIEALLSLAGVQTSPFGGGLGNISDSLSTALEKVLGADFSKLLPVASTDNGGLNLAVNVDEALNIFGVNAPVQFGNLSLAYKCSTDSSAAHFVASAPALGLGLDFCGQSGEIEVPDTANYFDLANLLSTVNGAWEEVNAVINGGAIAFEIGQGETYLSLDGILVEIWGNGEICWKKGSEYVALDLEFSIAEGQTADVASFKLIYDKNAVDTPLVKLALNEIGLDIYHDDIDSVKNGFNEIYSKISALLGGKDDSNSQPEVTEGGHKQPAQKLSYDNLFNVIFGVLSSDGWVDVLNDLTFSSDGKVVALSYLSDNAANIEIGTRGGLYLHYDGAFGKRFTLSGTVAASSDTGSLVDVINAKLKTCKVSSSKAEGSAPFIKLAYDFLFEGISGISVENILGSQTYAVKFNLTGANTNIPELEDVFIDAEIYVTGEKNEQGKLAEANLNVDAAGVVLKLNVITERVGNNTHFYINLSQVMDIKLPDLKFLATQESLYDTIEVLIKTVNDTNVLDVFGSLLSSSGTEEQPPANATESDKQESEMISQTAIDKIADLLQKLIDFNFSQAVVATETDGVMTASIDLDNIVKQFGIQTGALGTVEAVIDHNSHSMKTSGKTLKTDENGEKSLKEWISLSSELAARRDYSKLNKDDYISIEFLPTLIDDLVKFATDDNGKLHNSFTLSGSVTANIVNLFTLNIDTCTVTAAIDKEKGLTLSVVAHVKKVSALGLVTVPDSTFGITYQNGLLTLARGLNTSTPEYKVMTFDFFIDHMLTESNSSLQWLLNISGWKTLLSTVKLAAGDLNISSGLTTPENIYLYKANAVKDEQEISMYDFVEAINVIINGNRTAHFGNASALEKALGVSDNYYGFSLNAAAITGGTLTELYAAITRSEGGISGVKAYGAIQSYVTFSVNLNYNENCSEEYITGTTLTAGVSAPDLYDKAKAIADQANQTIDKDYFVKKPESGYDEKFGCFSITVGANGYEFNTENSNILYSHVLTVVGLNGEVETRDVRHGSTVYLYDNYSPVFTDNSKAFRLLYSTSQTEVGGTQVIMDGDLTVYAIAVKAVNVIVHNGEEQITLSSFVGDKVPLTVEGLQTVGAPVYEDGSAVGANDRVPDVTNLHIYGVFVQTEAVVNYVKYTFSSQTMSYTASGKAAGFNDYYSVKGNALVLENAIGGYPVTAIAANAFANTDGKPIKSVIVPENIVTVGENAFADNIDMQSAVFLAENVTFLGKDGNNKTMPFYGCSVSGNEEKTVLKVYYNNITASGGNWKHFRYVSKVFSFNFYIGDNGGAAYSAGQWQYVESKVNVNLNGVSGSTLTQQAVTDILAPYFPYACAGNYEGSEYAAEVDNAAEKAFTQFDILRSGILYKCVFTTEITQNGGVTTVTYNVSYTAAATVKVKSGIEFVYYGVTVKANTLTEITVPVEGEEINLAIPVCATHNFEGWNITEEDGATVYNAVWSAKEFTLKLRLTRGGTDTNIVYVDSSTYRVNGSGVKGTTDVTEIKIYGGGATFTVSDKVLTITTNGVTYTVYVNEASVLGKDKNTKRNIKSDINGAVTVTDDMTLTLSY